jgi:hypothetical protein
MSIDRRRFIQGAIAGGMSRAAAGSRVPDAVGCRFVDEVTKQPVAVRVRLTDAQGREVIPQGHAETFRTDAQEGDVSIQSRRFFYSNGELLISPERLPVRYEAVKGYEYLIGKGEIRREDLHGGSLKVPLRRWSALAERGWYSGDIHIHHIRPSSCRLEMDAEDLNVANILTSDFTADQDQFEGKVNDLSGGRQLIYVSQEFRHDDLGHLCLLNLKRLVQPVKPIQTLHSPLHLRVYDEVHGQGGYVSWAHFPSWPGLESPLDVAMEKLDGLEIMCQLEPREFPIFVRQVVPELEANDGLRLWYRYLNCGFRLTATAGTDKMTAFVTVGANRVFARVDGDFTYQAWIDALKAGRTFVTNSPVLQLTVNGREPGANVQVDSKQRAVAEIFAAADSQLPYHRLEIVCNGRVIAETSPTGPHYHAEIRLEQPIRSSCWVAARALEDIDPYRKAGFQFTTVHSPQGTLHGNYYGTRRPETVFAHTSPVYVIRDGQPIRNWDDADYYARYLDRCIQWLKTDGRFASENDRQSTIAAFQEARAVYLKRAADAPRPK